MISQSQYGILRSPYDWFKAHLSDKGEDDMRNAKSLAVAQYILDQRLAAGDRLTPMQLIKLAYIAQGYMLGKHGRPLFDEPVEAWQYGPVVPSVYHAVKHFRSSPVTTIPDAPSDYEFSVDERSIMDTVAKEYGPHGGVVLSTATHQPGTPWHQTWSALGKNAEISNDLIEDFYSDILKKKKHSAL
jgi:uncharacterized phage-associated protein